MAFPPFYPIPVVCKWSLRKLTRSLHWTANSFPPCYFKTSISNSQVNEFNLIPMAATTIVIKLKLERRIRLTSLRYFLKWAAAGEKATRQMSNIDTKLFDNILQKSWFNWIRTTGEKSLQCWTFGDSETRRRRIHSGWKLDTVYARFRGESTLTGEWEVAS